MNKYFDRLFDSLVEYIFRKKSLNSILFLLLSLLVAELAALGKSAGFSSLLTEIKIRYPEGLIYWIARISEVLFLEGSTLVLVITLVLIAVFSILKYRELNTKSLDDLNEIYKARYEEKRKEAQNALQERDEAREKGTELKGFLSKINQTLQRENISKEDLINKVSHKLKVIILYKSYEGQDKVIRDEIYPDIGVINITSGLCILPPQRIDQEKSDNEIIEWFKNEVTLKLPESYEFNLPLIAVADLTNVTYMKYLEPYRRFKTTFIDKIPLDELLSIADVDRVLKVKKHLSAKDILELPNLCFLVEDFMVSVEDYEKLRAHNDEIVYVIQEETGCNQLASTNLATIDRALLIRVLSEYVKDSSQIADRIIENASFWKNYFANRI